MELAARMDSKWQAYKLARDKRAKQTQTLDMQLDMQSGQHKVNTRKRKKYEHII